MAQARLGGGGDSHRHLDEFAIFSCWRNAVGMSFSAQAYDQAEHLNRPVAASCVITRSPCSAPSSVSSSNAVPLGRSQHPLVGAGQGDDKVGGGLPGSGQREVAGQWRWCERAATLHVRRVYCRV